MKKHLLFAAGFGAVFLPLWWPVLFMGQALTRHDYALQHLPWAHAYAQALKADVFPLWTPLIHGGFPLFAEGQAAMLYPLNLISYRILPFEWAYRIGPVLHLLLAGVATYAFALKRRLSVEAATCASLAFCFGSVHGGLIGSAVALRALAWFPAMLILADEWLERGKLRTLALLSFVCAQSLLAGAPQSAFYAILFALAYLALRVREERDRMPLQRFGYALLAIGLAGIIALPQLWATAEWATHSTRALQGPGFALWGSVAPWSWATIFFFAMTRVLRFGLYIGIWPALACWSARRERSLRVPLWLGLSAMALALGIFNPLLWLVAKLPVFSMLRNPSKFLFFAAFFFSIAGAFAIERVTEPSKKMSALLRSLALLLGALISAFLIVRLTSPALNSFGAWYVEHFVQGQSHHRGSHEFYAQRIQELLALLKAEIAPSNGWLWLPLLWVALYFLTGDRRRWAVWVLAADLLAFGLSGYATGLGGNLGPFPEMARISSLPTDGRWLDLTTGENALMPANQNMISGHQQIGAYAPLVDKEYYALTGRLGALDDSLGRLPVDISRWDELRPLIDRIGVRYIASPVTLEGEGLSLLKTMGQVRLYRNERAAASYRFADPEDGAVRIIGDHGPLETIVEVEAKGPSTLVRASTFDPGWKVWVDDRPEMLERVDTIFQGVRLEPGEHTVRYLYRPAAFSLGVWAYVIGFLLIAAVLGGCFKRNVIL